MRKYGVFEVLICLMPLLAIVVFAIGAVWFEVAVARTSNPFKPHRDANCQAAGARDVIGAVNTCPVGRT